MKYVPKNNAEPVPGLPMYVEVETDGGFHVTTVWLVVGNRRFECTPDLRVLKVFTTDGDK